MSSFEQDQLKKIKEGVRSNDTLDVGLVKFLWQANVLNRTSKKTIPRFLRDLTILEDFSELELRNLSKFMHVRNFTANEIIFRKGDIALGFYFVFEGAVSIFNEEIGTKADSLQPVLTLARYDDFGELGLLQKDTTRSVSAVAKIPTVLIGIFQPDLDELVEAYPVIATKLIKSVSTIVAQRLFEVMQEVKLLQDKIRTLENK